MSNPESLRERANFYAYALSHHEILKNYWDRLSLILKGSITGGADEKLSDVDFVLFCPEELWDPIIGEYRERGFISRKDGIYLPLGDWEGHYSLDTYENAEQLFEDEDMPAAWEYSTAVVLHDPDGRFAGIVREGMYDLFVTPSSQIKKVYIEAQLALDWMRHPPRRDDSVTVVLHTSQMLRYLCMLCYLLDKKPYPHDKWLFRHIRDTRAGAEIAGHLEKYAVGMGKLSGAHKYRETDKYPQYAEAQKMLLRLETMINNMCGEPPWTKYWKLFV